jgi:transcriptional regulator with XRE-family HTH domain
MPRVGNPKRRRRTFIKAWRVFRNLTQEQLAERLRTTKANISRVETGNQGYTQDFLEACAEALGTDVANLLMRDPSHPDAIWSIWEKAKPAERAMIVDIAKTVTKKTGT